MNETTIEPVEPATARRRSLLVGGVAAAAAIAGAGVALWKWSPDKATKSELAAMWAMSFDTPAGAQLAMQSLRGRPLLVNFWATWCPPCVEEMPLLDAFYR